MSEPRPRVIRVSSGEFNDAEYERELARQPKMELPPIETEVIATQPKAPVPAPVRQQQQQQPPQPKQQQHPPQKRRTPPPPTTPRTARVPVYEPEAPLSAAGAAAASKLTSSSPIVRLLSVVPEPDEELAKLRDVETYVRDLAKCARSLRASVLTETATGEALTIVAGMFAEDLFAARRGGPRSAGALRHVGEGPAECSAALRRPGARDDPRRTLPGRTVRRAAAAAAAADEAAISGPGRTSTTCAPAAARTAAARASGGGTSPSAERRRVRGTRRNGRDG